MIFHEIICLSQILYLVKPKLGNKTNHVTLEINTRFDAEFKIFLKENFEDLQLLCILQKIAQTK